MDGVREEFLGVIVLHDGIIGSTHGIAGAKAKKLEAAWHIQDPPGLRERQERWLSGEELVLYTP